MDRQDTLRNILIAAAVALGVMMIAPRLLTPPTPPPQPTTGDTELPTRAADAKPERAVPDLAEQSGLHADEAEEVSTVVIGADLSEGVDRRNPPPYRMRLTLSNVGASVEAAEMADHAAEVDSDDPYRLLSPVSGPEGKAYRSLAVEKINVDDADVTLSDKRWHFKPAEPYVGGPGGDDEAGQKVEFWIDVQRNGAPILRVTRTFRLPEQSRESGRHDVWSDLSVENLSNQQHRVVLTYRGGLGLPQDDYRGGDRVIDYGVTDGEGRVLGARTANQEIAQQGAQAIKLFTAAPGEQSGRLSWAAAGNKYFTCTIAPSAPQRTDTTTNVASLLAVDLDHSAQSVDDVTVQLVTGAATLAGNQRITYPAELYIGEKEGAAFREVPAYAARNYYFQIAQGFGWCTFTWLVELMIWLLNGLHALIPDFGVAIVVLVLIVRTLLHPITKKGQVNMVRMQKQMGELSPKLEEIKKKYANDKARYQQEMMKVYRDHGVSPAGQLTGCLPIGLQMPVWFALFLSLNNNIRMRHEGAFFLPWIGDLTAPDALYQFSSPLPLIGETFNLLPLFVALFMYIQQKTQPKPKPNPNQSEQQRAQQEMMQKMMPFMSIIMLVFFYHMPSGLNLYIMFSSLFGWIEQTYIRRHIKEREEAGTLHKTPGKTDGTFGRKKRPGQMTFIERLQNMAEQAQKAPPRRPSKKGSKR